MQPHDLKDAVKLATYGLRPKVFVKDDDEYARLLETYNNNHEFAELVNMTAEGLELRVISKSRTQLFCVPKPNSLFAKRKKRDPLTAAIYLAVINVAFPTARAIEQALADGSIVNPVMVEDVTRLIRDFIATLDSSDDIPGADNLLARIDEMPDDNETENARALSLGGWIRRSLTELEEAGLLTTANGEVDGPLYATDRLTYAAMDLAEHPVFRNYFIGEDYESH